MHARKSLGLAFALTLVAACGSSETTSSTSSTSSSSSGTGGAPGTTSSTGSGAGGVGGGADLTIQSYQSDIAGPAVDSHLIFGSKKAP